MTDAVSDRVYKAARARSFAPLTLMPVTRRGARDLSDPVARVPRSEVELPPAGAGAEIADALE